MPDRTNQMLCPTDGTALAMSERQGIEIDYCPQCRGVWLDRGELDKIIERNAVEAPAPEQGYVQPGYRQGGREAGHRERGFSDSHSGYGHRGRKKSFLENLFD